MIRTHVCLQYLHFSAQMNIYGVPMTLITSHLESTMDFSAERTHQMQRCFEEVDTAPPGDHVLFGGDLNLRDKEVSLP